MCVCMDMPTCPDEKEEPAGYGKKTKRVEASVVQVPIELGDQPVKGGNVCEWTCQRAQTCV